MSGRSRASSSNGRRRDADVLRAATKTFHERGYAAATVQDVADELQILKGSLYHYIRTKEDLLFLVFKSRHEDVDEILTELEQATELSPLRRLYEYVRQQVEYNAQNLEAMSVYHNDMEYLTGDQLAEVVASRDRHASFVTGLITQAQRDGDAPADMVPRVMTPCVFAPITGTYRWYRPTGRLGPSEVAEQIARFTVRGIAPTSEFVATLSEAA